MPQLPIRRLRAELATAVRRAAAGEVLVVTVGGRSAAQLAPVGAPATDRPGAGPGEPPRPSAAELVARGVLVAPRRTDRHRPGPAVPVWRAARLDRALDGVR